MSDWYLINAPASLGRRLKAATRGRLSKKVETPAGKRVIRNPTSAKKKKILLQLTAISQQCGTPSFPSAIDGDQR